MQCTAARRWMLSRLLNGLEHAMSIPVMVLLAFAVW